MVVRAVSSLHPTIRDRDLAFTLTLESPAPVQEVLAAIREETWEWRESAMPADLRARGHVKVSSQMKGPHFTLGYESTAPDRLPIELEGEVVAAGAGSRIIATCGRPSWWIGPAVFSGAGVVLVLSGGAGGLVAFPIAAGLAAVLWWRHAGVTWDSAREGRYLAERLDRAVARTTRTVG